MTDKTLQDRLRLLAYAYDLPDCTEAADALDAQEARIKALEGALGMLVGWADGPSASISVVSAAHDRIVDRARALLGEK